MCARRVARAWKTVDVATVRDRARALRGAHYLATERHSRHVPPRPAVPPWRPSNGQPSRPSPARRHGPAHGPAPSDPARQRWPLQSRLLPRKIRTMDRLPSMKLCCGGHAGHAAASPVDPGGRGGHLRHPRKTTVSPTTPESRLARDCCALHASLARRTTCLVLQLLTHSQRALVDRDGI